MTYNEEIFKKEVETLYNGEIEVIGRFKNIISPILLKDKYGVLSCSRAINALNNRPTIKVALNKTEYFMNQLKEKHPEIYNDIKPLSEYKAMKEPMLFETKFGTVSATPDNLIHGHKPNIRSAVDRKTYFKNQLLFLYDNKYDFEITSTDRHKGRVTLICPIHGKQSIDSDSIFLGCGCPECNHGWEKSNVFYLIRLYDEIESFYKLGISYRKPNGKIRRFEDYKTLKYEIEVIKTIDFDDFVEAKEFETELKQLIKNNLYTPNRWENNTSTECFTNELLPILLNKINYDIVSTSDENQSSPKVDGEELTKPLEDI